jgi:hypothetical protein
MRVDLWRIKLLFKAKIQPANSSSSSSHGGYERHNTKIDGQMYSGDTKIVDLVGEHLQIKEKTRMREGVGAGNRKRNGEEEEDLFSPPLRSIF